MTVRVSVPASSANLGPGYDILALALDMHLRVEIEALDSSESTLAVKGEGADRLRLGDSNRFVAGFRAGWLEGRPGATVPGLRIRMDNAIPLARGLGSSAAATVAGLLASRALRGSRRGGKEIGEDRLLELATAIEGHPENAAAALLGGFVVCAAGRVTRFDPPRELRVALYIPERELATADMRAVLPQEIVHADAVANAGHVANIVTAFGTGELSLLSSMYEDRLHEPFRSAAYPEFQTLVAAARRAGALGAALSGAGSAVIALCGDDRSVSSVVDAMTDAAVGLKLEGRCEVVDVAEAGAEAGGST